MASYGSQILVVGSQPVGFDHNITNPNNTIKPNTAFGIVEDGDIRLSASEEPTATTGLLATIGSSITITGEHDIENFRAISIDPYNSAKIYFEFGTNT
jgi:hypothetical protein